MRIPQRIALALAVAAVVSSCGSPASAPGRLAQHLAPLPRPATCNQGEDESDRLVVDWPPLERSKLESAVRRGVVLVHVSGCSAHLVDGCSTRRRYEYSPTSRQREVVTVRDRGELGAKLPLGALRFTASLEESSALHVAMTVVGRYESEPRPLPASDLEGSCDGVTHVVANISVGSFVITSASDGRLEGSASSIAFASHARGEAERRRLDSAGVEDRCAEAKRSDAAPPEDCGIPLRIELRRLGAPAPAPAATPTRPPPDELRSVMKLARREAAPCYREALARDENLAGTLTLAIAVGREGNVRSISAKHDVAAPLASCVVSRIEHVGVPPATDDRPRVYVVPFAFNRATRPDAP